MLLPATSPNTTLIEVVRITDPARHLTAPDLAGDTIALGDEQQARQVLALLRDLPGGEVQRCFLPGWGIRAHSSTDQLFEAAFCFRCHGARFWAPGLPAPQQHQTFDAESLAGQELLHCFRTGLPR